VEDDLRRAISAHEQGDIATAQRHYHEVLRRQPQHALSRRNLGLIALSTGHYAAAVTLIGQALQLQPEHGQWYGNLAQAQRLAGDADAALESFQRAVSMHPVNPFHHYLRAELLLDMRRIKEGIAALHQALQLDPHITEAYASLAFLASTGDYAFSNAEQQQLARLLDDDSLSTAQRYPLHFAMASLSESNGDHAQAFAHYVSANQYKRQTHKDFERFDAEREHALFTSHAAIFSDEFLTARRTWGHASGQPVFIVGLLRTGSTLLERIVCCHPEIEGRGELTDMRLIARSKLPGLTGGDYPQCLLQVDATMLRSAADWYLQRLNAGGPSSMRIINKMPFDFQLLGLIHLLFPQASIIHTVRQPVATLWSCFTRDVHARFSNDFSDLIAVYRLYRQYMQLWQTLLPAQIHSVRYEALIDDFKPVVTTALQHLGLDWHEHCRQFHQQTDSVATPSRMQVRKPIYRDANAAWQPYAAMIQPLIDAISEIDDEFGPQ